MRELEEELTEELLLELESVELTLLLELDAGAELLLEDLELELTELELCVLHCADFGKNAQNKELEATTCASPLTRDAFTA
jgi:hypothetical protein